MPIDRFTIDQFEAVLPVNKDTGEKLWESTGFRQGEHEYVLPVQRSDVEDGRILIVIRSSIDSTGVAGDTGEDSIRVWLEAEVADCDPEGNAIWVRQPIGKTAGRWITRVNGWDKRLTNKLREMYTIGRKVERCQKCGVWKRVYVVKDRKSENIGRLFQKCTVCKSGFKWLS